MMDMAKGIDKLSASRQMGLLNRAVELASLVEGGAGKQLMIMAEEIKAKGRRMIMEAIDADVVVDAFLGEHKAHCGGGLESRPSLYP